jgi:transposase-like protein
MDADENALPISRQQLRTREEWRTQALLFDEIDAGSELLTIEQDRTANRHTGSTLERREELRAAICDRLCEGVSQRRIAREFGVSRNTLAKLIERLETAGKMEPHKKRMSRKLARVIEAGTEEFMTMLEEGRVPVNVLPVAVGIFSDKKALLDGEPTAIVTTTEKPAIQPADWDRWLESLPRANGPIDSESTGNAQKTLQIPIISSYDTTRDTTTTPPDSTSAPAAPPLDGQRADTGGRGSGDAEEVDGAVES